MRESVGVGMWIRERSMRALRRLEPSWWRHGRERLAYRCSTERTECLLFKKIIISRNMASSTLIISALKSQAIDSDGNVFYQWHLYRYSDNWNHVTGRHIDLHRVFSWNSGPCCANQLSSKRNYFCHNIKIVIGI